MRTVFMMVLLFSACMNCSMATCKSTSTSFSHNSDVTIDEMFPVTQQFSTSISATFSGIKCDSANDSISYISPVKESVIGPFSNGEKLKITVQAEKNAETIGTTNTVSKTVKYTVTVTHVSDGNTGSGGDAVYVPGVLVANTGGNSNTLINTILGFCKSLSWSGCVNYITGMLKGDSYVENLTLYYRPKKTTCRPGNMTQTLPDVALSELPESGKLSSKSRSDEIHLYCADLVGANRQTTRGVSVYLYSDELWGNSRSVLRGMTEAGVGFVIENNNKVVTLSTVKGMRNDADKLWSVAKGDRLSTQELLIPIKTSYYVYDRKKVKPGELQAKALIFVNYE